MEKIIQKFDCIQKLATKLYHMNYVKKMDNSFKKLKYYDEAMYDARNRDCTDEICYNL